MQKVSIFIFALVGMFTFANVSYGRTFGGRHPRHGACELYHAANQMPYDPVPGYDALIDQIYSRAISEIGNQVQSMRDLKPSYDPMVGQNIDTSMGARIYLTGTMDAYSVSMYGDKFSLPGNDDYYRGSAGVLVTSAQYGSDGQLVTCHVTLYLPKHYLFFNGKTGMPLSINNNPVAIPVHEINLMDFQP